MHHEPMGLSWTRLPAIFTACLQSFSLVLESALLFLSSAADAGLCMCSGACSSLVLESALLFLSSAADPGLCMCSGACESKVRLKRATRCCNSKPLVFAPLLDGAAGRSERSWLGRPECVSKACERATATAPPTCAVPSCLLDLWWAAVLSSSPPPLCSCLVPACSLLGSCAELIASNSLQFHRACDVSSSFRPSCL
jgi:hypothetical protein